jgi:hypothetical protein
VRRLFNQALFERLSVHEDGEITHELAEPFKLLLDPELPERLMAAAREEGPVRLDQLASSSHEVDNEDGLVENEAVGSNLKVLVEAAGIEPASTDASAESLQA